MNFTRRRVMDLVSVGMTDKRIAREMGMSVPAICKQVLSARKELGAANRIAAAVVWSRGLTFDQVEELKMLCMEHNIATSRITCEMNVSRLEDIHLIDYDRVMQFVNAVIAKQKETA